MRKYLLSMICFMLFLSSALRAQIPGLPNSPRSAYINLQKYWWYRYRLVNDFMKIGPECGESIPAQRRDSANSPHLSRLEWGDATIDLGNYLAMLATEHKLLSNNGLETGRTKMELFYALNAFERLDGYSDAYCRHIDDYYPCKAQIYDLDGFFIRDDVPFTTFGENSIWGVANPKSHFNRPGIIKHIPQRDEYVDGSFNGRTNVPSSGITVSWPYSVQRVPTEESADQVCQITMGFALASKLTSGQFYSPSGTPIDLGFKAAQNFHRVVERPKLAWRKPWRIENPTTLECVYGIFPAHPSCSNGGAFFMFQAYGASKACDSWGAGGFGSPNKTLWESTQFASDIHDAGFFSTLAAMTPRSWTFGGKDQTWKRMRQFATANDNCSPHVPYLYRVMTGNGEAFRIKETIDILDAAPGCGIHNYKGDFANEYNVFTGKFEHNSGTAWHWSGNDLVHEWYSRTGDPTSYYRDHNGLDYMVLFNLFALQCTPDGIYTTSYFNPYYKENFNMSFPSTKLFPGFIGSVALGDNINKLKLNFLEYLSIRSKINDDGNLTVRGAKVIDLLPGFETKGESSFLAYVKDYDINCGQYLGRDEHGNNIGIPGERYVYAEVTGPKSTWTPQSGFFPGQGGNGDTTISLDFAPDGVDYVPDTSIHNGNDSLNSMTCAEEHAYFDSLAAKIYATGDIDEIDYLDSVIIPNLIFPACDTTGDSTNGPVASFRLTNQDTTGGQSFNFNIYPNPNNGQFTIAFDEQGYYDVSIINSLGAEVYNTQVYNRRSEIVRMEGIVPGLYMVLMQNSKDRKVVHKRKLIIK